MGPAVPFIEAGTAIFGAISGANAQRQQAAAASAENSQSNALAQELARGPNLAPIVEAEASGANTLLEGAGGIPNIGRVTSNVLGNNIQNAITSALQTRNQGLEAAAGIEEHLGTQSGGYAQGMGNPYLSGLTSLLGMFQKGGPWASTPSATPNTGTVTGPGSAISQPIGAGAGGNYTPPPPPAGPWG